ncbi:hypothetical protein R3P38DRAFT_2815098 [Favolaschia claudopus]|uniref:Uncharacterized protein n=1 Tax=Favolaschia claudopus TaxID=2862362 RepID=A0AAV9Z2C1_9AGAR
MSLPEGGPEPTVFEERLTSGLYDELVESLQAMGNSALGNVDCPNDFTRASTSFQPIDDSKKSVKDVLALVTPTLACNRLLIFFQNQTVPLRDAIEHELALESRAVPYQEYILRPWMRSIQEDSGQDDIIMVHMLPKYGVPASAAQQPLRPARRGKRKLDDVVQTVYEFSCCRSEFRKLPNQVSASLTIRLGAYYDPRLLCDYGGDYFRQVKAMLVQLDGVQQIAKIRSSLLGISMIVCVLGTLVLVDASLHIFVMNDTDSKGAIRPKKRKIYQINAHSIKILAKSDFPIEERKWRESFFECPWWFFWFSFCVGSRARFCWSSGSSVVAGSSQSAAPSGSSSLSQGSVVDIDVDVPDADSVKSKRARSAGKKIGAASSSHDWPLSPCLRFNIFYVFDFHRTCPHSQGDRSWPADGGSLIVVMGGIGDKTFLRYCCPSEF